MARTGTQFLLMVVVVAAVTIIPAVLILSFNPVGGFFDFAGDEISEQAKEHETPTADVEERETPGGEQQPPPTGGATPTRCTNDADCGSGTTCNTDINQCVATGTACTALRQNGPPSEKADILFIGKDYSSADTLANDIAYYLDYPHQTDGPSGLFNQPPMADDTEIFNVWYITAGSSISDYGENLYDDVNTFIQRCPFSDYNVVFTDGEPGRPNSFSSDDFMLMVDTRGTVSNQQPPSGFAHEWGHHFGNLKDEYTVQGGRDATPSAADIDRLVASNKLINCVDTRSQAERVWGHLTDTESAGYYRGCAYNDGNWRPHRSSIMGNGGFADYGPVGNRMIERVINRYE